MSAPTVLAVFCGVALLAVAVRARSWPDSQPVNPKWMALLALATLPAFVVIGHVALTLDDVPYNIKELFENRTTLSLTLLWASLAACGAAPMALATLWLARPYVFVATVVPLLVLAGTVTFLLLSIAVPVESLDDVVGTPVLNIGPSLERCLRFQGLIAAPLIGWALGARLTMGTYDRRFFAGLAAAAAVLLISYIVVVRLACTVNLTELLPERGKSCRVVALPAWLALLGMVSALPSKAMMSPPHGRLERLALATLVVCLSIPLGWQLLVAGTNPQLDKYGQVFSARQFLLSPDRDHLLDDGALFVRFAIAQIASVGCLTLGMLLVLATNGINILKMMLQVPKRRSPGGHEIGHQDCPE